MNSIKMFFCTMGIFTLCLLTSFVLIVIRDKNSSETISESKIDFDTIDSALHINSMLGDAAAVTSIKESFSVILTMNKY